MSPTATDTNGKYVDSVEVTNGTITIQYGKEANAKITGGLLSLTPYETPDASVTWQCGNAATPTNVTGLLGVNGTVTAAVGTTNLLDKYLPKACRV